MSEPVQVNISKRNLKLLKEEAKRQGKTLEQFMDDIGEKAIRRMLDAHAVVVTPQDGQHRGGRPTRSQEQVDALIAAGYCMGSEFLPRAYDDANNEGMCAHCQEYVPLDGRLVGRHDAK